MNKNLNIVIFGLLILSIWAILSIGISLIPLINLSILSIETTTKINMCLLNIAYSFLAGFIMYVFTVIIPYNNRKKINLTFINHNIQNYCLSSSASFITCCFKIKSIEYNEVDIKKIEKLKQSVLKQKYGENLWEQCFVNNPNELKDWLIKMSGETKDFINTLIPYFDFLSEEQLLIINDIRTDGILSYIDFYLYFERHPLSEVESLYKILSKHDELINKLNLTLGDYNKIKPSKKEAKNPFILFFSDKAQNKHK